MLLGVVSLEAWVSQADLPTLAWLW